MSDDEITYPPDELLHNYISYMRDCNELRLHTVIAALNALRDMIASRDAEIDRLTEALNRLTALIGDDDAPDA